MRNNKDFFMRKILIAIVLIAVVAGIIWVMHIKSVKEKEMEKWVENTTKKTEKRVEKEVEKKMEEMSTDFAIPSAGYRDDKVYVSVSNTGIAEIDLSKIKIYVNGNGA